ncbi:histone acetylation protein-domain-containing protein [Xylariomycetidae sp. FL0641]|nr:histone acetylation protein-domain-containing protein [Xylariomycetidae sp. FL0641]
MASPNQPGSRGAKTNPLLHALAAALPKAFRFNAYHLSTTPSLHDALCYPPTLPSDEIERTERDGAKASDKRPGKPLRTYCEKHFLAISTDVAKDNAGQQEVLVLGLEIYIYTTSFSSIIFVSKADSTGYLALLDLPKGTPSPIREVTTAFISFLVANRRRSSKQLVVNLFARSQAQYLFPGSIKNNGKHVLDDRGLIKWWCRVLNPLLECNDQTRQACDGWEQRHAFLRIPGLDTYETRAFIPRTNVSSQNWTLGDPLPHISPYMQDSSTFGRDIPIRCIIPTYPDDPKARYVLDLEETTSDKTKLATGWKTPRTLEQFWDMMAFRTECSSGRMTGFAWVVFDPPKDSTSTREPALITPPSAAVLPTPNSSFSGAPDATPLPKRSLQEPLLATPTPSQQERKKRKRGKKKLTGPIITRKPRIKTHNRTHVSGKIETPYYYWPVAGRGEVVLNDSGYNRAMELLLNLEFKNLEVAATSTSRWVSEVNMGEDWALSITGQLVASSTQVTHSSGAVNNLDVVKRKRSTQGSGNEGTASSTTIVNTLDTSMVRKKAKKDAAASDSPSSETVKGEPDMSKSGAEVNVLGPGLIRKKPKAE